MKIAIIQPRISYFAGGSEKVSLRHIEYLSKYKDLEIYVYTVKASKNYTTEYKNILNNLKSKVNFHELEIPKRFEYIYKVFGGTNQDRWDSESILFSNLVYPFLCEKKFDVILSYYFVDTLFKPFCSKNIVYLGGYPRQEIPIYNSFLKFCDGTFSNSSNVYNRWKNMIDRGGISHNYIIKKGVDDIDLKKINNYFDNKIFNIVYAGRLIKRKGVDILIEAFGSFSKNKDNVKLWILGDGPADKELKKKAEILGDKVIFVGFKSNVYDYFYHSDLCIFPSLEGEGLMNSVCEAMKCGKCIITTKNNGNEEIIKNNINGFLVEPGNAKELKEKIEFLYLNPKIIKLISVNALSFAQQNFNWKEVAEDIHKKLLRITEKS